MRRFTIFAALLLTVMLVSLPALSQDVITTSIGGGPNGIPAIDANLYQPYGVAVDSTGNYYIASYNQNRVFKVNTAGTISVVAGSGAYGYSGDGVTGGAGNASLAHPFSVAADSSGNVYIADEYNCIVRKVDTTNTITTVAGIPNSCGFSGDGGKGTAAQLNFPLAVALDSSGNLFIGDNSNCVVRKVVISSNTITSYAGNHTCGYSGDNGAATSAELNSVGGVAADSSGNLFIADYGNCVIREVTKSSGKINTVAGNHTCGYSGDGALATSAEMNQVFGVTVNGTAVTFADYYNQRVRQFTVGGNVNTVAGNGTACGGTCGEGGLATSAELYYPVGVATTTGGTIYIADNDNYVVDSFTVGGNLNRAAGNHTYNLETLITGAPANGVELNYPYGIASDSSGNVYIDDSHNYMVRELVNSTGLVNFFAGNGTYGYTGDGGAATSAEMTNIEGVAKDSSGNVYIADTDNCLVRKVNTAGTISVFAGLVVSGSPRCGYSGDGGAATNAELYYPFAVKVDSKNNVYIADQYNHVVRKVTSGTITTIAGIGGEYGFSGDGGPATSAQLYYPADIAVDPAGNVFIADTSNCRIREVSAATGNISTVAGFGYLGSNCGFTGDGIAVSSGLYDPQGIAVDANDNLFIADSYNNRVRWVSPNGIMTTVGGNGTSGYTGDGGAATAAELSVPSGIALDSSGNILVSDYNNFRVRTITVFPAVSTSTGSMSFGLTAVGSTSSPLTMIVSAYGPVTISNISTSANFSEADNCPASMANGTTCTMYVYFVPTASGTLNGSVTINSNGYFNPVNTVSLSGLGSAISLTGAPLSFGNQLVKTTSAAQTVTVKNTGTSAITMNGTTLTDTTDYAISANTCPATGKTLAGGASCTISVTFGPTTTGLKRGSVVINDTDPSSPQLVGLSGTGTSNVSLSPSTITFATTAVGLTSANTKITLTNNTGVSITLGNPAVTVTGPFASASSTTCTKSLVIANKGTCVINADFKPTAVGFASGTISVTDSDVTSPQTVAMSGYGTGIKFTPTSINFGTVTKGTQVSSTVTITNVGATNVFFTGAEFSGTNSADFADNYGDAAPCGNNSSNPLKPGGTCTLTVYFTPSTTASESGTYKLFDNSVGSPQTLALSGKGQ
ncbi:MAG TPA: choice-of-anchor D domain-containing protein [Candidatus Dormibacteraeota bacterium]|nr:choice-of-anchor D domain-containing protein [Candidatus Dormibacteraeota bacterium]